MEATSWPPEFDRVLRSHLPWMAEEDSLAADLVLADKGLDSLETVSLLLDLEEEFGIRFPDEMLTSSSFDTPRSTWAMVHELRTTAE